MKTKEKAEVPFFSENQPTGDVLFSTRLRESNRRIVKKLLERNSYRTGILDVADQMMESYHVNILNKKAFGFWDEEAGEANFDFNWKKMREAVYGLREANAEGALQQFLRAGVNTITNGYYQLVETMHDSVMSTVPSSKAIELYAPLYRGSIPRQVQRGGPFAEGRVVGVDIQLRNRKFGNIMPFERELFEDDQTGQIRDRAQDGGQQMKILEDAWAFQKFIGSAGSFAGDPIPASETKPSDETGNWPWTTSATPFVGGGYNAPTSYGAFSSQLVQNGDAQLMQQLDRLGNLMLVNPNLLLVGTQNKFTARTLLNSEWYPSTAAMTVAAAGGGQTAIGTAFAKNVLEGLYNLVVARFLPVKAWALGEAGKGFVFQTRVPLEVIQENPQSGASFSADEFRFRTRSRFNVDAIEPRFWWLGNDGSI